MEEIEYPQWTLNGKFALVTGASKGLGKWIALGLAQAGADVAVVARNFEGVQETAQEIENMGRKALPVQADVSQIDNIDEMVKKTIETFGRIDILVNNAGTNVRKTVLEATAEDFDLVANVNFRGLYFASQIVAKEMVKKGEGGKIINISSAGGFLLRAGIPNSIYAGTKGGVVMFTKAFAEELAPYKINVNAVAPGYFATPLAKDRLSTPEVREKILFFTPLKSVGAAKDIIAPVIFLASDASDFITGQTIYTDGGRTVL
jgi:NAD(P)-dependent dehydrogenase (short-subunit alcohol dehydrogenase family)